MTDRTTYTVNGVTYERLDDVPEPMRTLIRQQLGPDGRLTFDPDKEVTITTRRTVVHVSEDTDIPPEEVREILRRARIDTDEGTEIVHRQSIGGYRKQPLLDRSAIIAIVLGLLVIGLLLFVF